MTSERWEQAERLAKRNYDIEVVRDVTTDGDPTYVASNPELPGCRSQGDTVEEAVNNLEQARIDYIFFLLEDGLKVPEPAPRAVTTSSGATQIVVMQAVYQAGSEVPRDIDGQPLSDNEPLRQNFRESLAT